MEETKKKQWYHTAQGTLNFLLLLKLIYAVIIYSTIVFDLGMNNVGKNLFCFIIIAISIFGRDCLFRFKLKESNSTYGTKTYVIMGIYIILTLFCFFLQYNHQIKDDGIMLMLILADLSNVGLEFIDCLNMEQKNYVKLSGYNYLWIILMPILLMLQNYIHLPSWYIISIIVLESIWGGFIEYVSVMCWIVHH